MREVEASAEVVQLTVHICGDVNGSLAEGEDDGEDEAMAGDPSATHESDYSPF